MEEGGTGHEKERKDGARGNIQKRDGRLLPGCTFGQGHRDTPSRLAPLFLSLSPECHHLKGISTDLVPTLLNMYDALYARLNEGADVLSTIRAGEGGDDGGGAGGRRGGGVGGGGGEGSAKCLSNGLVDLSNIGQDETKSAKETENGAIENGVCGDNNDTRLFIEEKDLENGNQMNNNSINSRDKTLIKCDKCGALRRTTTSECRCISKMSISESICTLFDNIETGLDRNTTSDTFYDNFEKRLRKEHIYAEPEFVIKPKDSPKSITSTSTMSSSNTHTSSSVITSSNSSLSLKTPGTPTSPPMGQDPRKFKGVYRPLSAISSSSSSSSSSNSLPRGPVESLEDNDADHSDTEETTRRRDRTIKTRREKAQRTGCLRLPQDLDLSSEIPGSGDSGVQCHSISLPAPPTLRPKYYDPNLDYMDRIVLEIVETEAIYVRDLREIIEGYLEYWRRHPESGIGQSQAEDLFSNIEQIYTFNRGFLSELEACGVDPVAVARCFVRNNSGFAIYTQYCTNYPRTVSVLTELMRGEASVRAFRERQLALSHTLPLGSYLLKPVQRILKYHLLLGNIVKHFEKDCSGYSEIWNALSAMTGMAHHINDMKRKHEHAVRVQEIQSLLYGWQFEDLTTYGELAAEGTFRMCGAKGLRHIFLFEKMILIAKKKEENTLMYKAHILCSNLMLIESVPGEPLSFHIIPFDNPRMQYTLEARNLEQKREWTLQLKRVILENYSANIPAHARQLVMELGQSKPEDLLMSESRSSGRRAHHAPEYLERRKAHDRRRASEGGLNTRLRLRRSSRTRKEKEEKESRSRSASRTRETDEEADRKISTNSAPSSSEKSKLKIPSMWGRRRSEPGIGSRESLSVTLSAPEDINTPSPDTTIDISMNTPNEAITPEISVDGLSASEYEREEEPENGENLEEIVSKILQRELQLQKLLLNKQRRNLVRKIPFKYDTSDTENEDGPCCRNNEPYPGSENHSTQRNDDVGDYVDFYFNEGQCTTHNESANASSSECQSLYSSAVSVHNQITGDFRPLNSEKPNKPVRRSSSDLSFKKAPASKKNTNYDNLINIWSTLRGKSPEKKHGSLTPQPKHSEISVNSLEKPRLRRAQSFSIEKCLNSNSENIYASPAQLVPQPNTAPVQSSKKEDIWVKDENRGSPRENRERPVTIAIYNSNEVSLSALEQYLSQPRSSGHTPERFPYDTEDNFTDYSMTPHMSMDNILSIHPEHKIYKPSNNRNTLKHVFNKITSPKSSKSISEPSGSVFNYSVESELDRNIGDKKASKMVYNMARQCSRTLKERIKQIRAEDGDRSPGIKSESLYSLPIYKQGSSSIGARLAGTNEPSDYAVPRIRPMDQKPKSELRPDSVLSSSSILTSSSSSSSSSSRDTKFLEGVEVSSMANVEEENEEIQESPSFESDASADSYYERSFEAIENLETEIFRDSAIYSDPEDPESPPSSLNQDRSPTSPKSRSSVSRKPSSRSSKNNPASAKFRSIESNSALKSTKITSEENTAPKSTESSGLSPQPKKVPPPVPAKPENIKSRKSRACGTLITQQLKNLEECSKPNLSEQASSFEGIRSLDERRKDLRVQIKIEGEDDTEISRKDFNDGEFSTFRHSRLTKSPSLMTPPIIKNPITLSPLSNLSVSPLHVIRSSSVPPRLSPRPSLTPESPKPSSLGTASPMESERNSPLPSGVAHTCENAEGEEPRVARGWVKHVIGKLQAESDV
ncbi:uncharacterized protein [Macrobrachium rosenbergii]|uniref:uncharacterized protein isoform X1 n=1 Tax=Macrobrachium rosenbergii TaxID=79674 RepID=UPI0034D43FB0